ncbi:hypothetical protein [Costertonia aggregata]|uniref:Uncharacterized protein n=1 Tax=Costertonia aggregata TaxID=343403 RepID=A0A7H9ATJ6_9FLAO|nr:hypothetical protein [Costertonia aggregata]QLG46798.1 hypothetical protein HYG79_16050 [Costertonia aggregata]
MKIKKFKSIAELFEMAPQVKPFLVKEVYEFALGGDLDYDEWLNTPFEGSLVLGDVTTEGTIIDIYKQIDQEGFNPDNIIFSGNLEVGTVTLVDDIQKIFVCGDFITQVLSNICGWFYVQGDTTIQTMLHFDSDDNGFTKLKLKNEVPIIITTANFFDINLKAKCFIDASYQKNPATDTGVNKHTEIINSKFENIENTTFFTPKEYVDSVFSNFPEETKSQAYDIDYLVKVHTHYLFENQMPTILAKVEEVIKSKRDNN